MTSNFITLQDNFSISVRLTSDRTEQTPCLAWKVRNIASQCSDCACYLGGLSPVIQGFHLTTPVFYALELTPVCNNRCLGCSNVFIVQQEKTTRQGQNRNNPLDANNWRAVLDCIAPYAYSLKVTGGEPTLHPQFQEIILDIDKRGIPYTVFTNGRWQNPRELIDLLKSVSNCTGLLISLHGATPEAHEAFSGVPGSFEETIHNIRLAVDSGLTVVTSTVITSHNWDEIETIADLAKDLGADHAVFSRYSGPCLPLVEPTDEQLTEAVTTVVRLQEEGKRIKFGNCIPQCFVPNSSTGCLAGVAYCAVDPWGNLRPCTHDDLVCANLLEHSVEEIWHGSAMEKWRSAVPEECSICSALPKCNAGCRAMARQTKHGKDPLSKKPLAMQEWPQKTRTLILYESSHPLRNWALRAETFGYVLVKGDRILPVRKDKKSLLDACDGQRTLLEIKAAFGPEGLSFVGALYALDFVELI